MAWFWELLGVVVEYFGYEGLVRDAQLFGFFFQVGEVLAIDA